MGTEYLSQFLMWSYCALNIGAFFLSSIPKSKTAFGISNVLLTLGTLISGQFAVAALCASVAARQLISVFTFEFSDKKRMWLCTSFVVCTSALIAYNWAGNVTWLLLLNGVWSTVVFFYARGKWFSFGLIIACVLWITNGILVDEITIVLASLPGLFISVYKFLKQDCQLAVLKTN